MSALATPSSALAEARASFAGGRGYLAACTVGLPPRATVRAVVADLEASASGAPDLVSYSAAVERSRGHFAELVRLSPARVAIGSQASVAAALVAAALPDGAEVLVPEGEFSSIVLPFVHAGRDIRVRSAPLAQLAEHVSATTSLIAFSIVQSATGDVADAEAVLAAAHRHGALTLCDATQAVGWLPVEASRYDAVICHAYKWLCAPRGVSFLTVSDRLAAAMPARLAGWYAGEDPWASCYGGDGRLAGDARRFDVSPAWQAFVGAAPALDLFASLDADALHARTTGLAAAFRTGADIADPQRASAIVTWADPDGDDLARLTRAGIVASGRAGRARVAFHVFNDEADVEMALTALGR